MNRDIDFHWIKIPYLSHREYSTEILRYSNDTLLFKQSFVTNIDNTNYLSVIYKYCFTLNFLQYD